MINLIALLTVHAFASTPFTSSAADLAAITNHPEVWRTYHGPIEKVEVVGRTDDSVTYRVTVRQSEQLFQPRPIVAGQRLGDPDFQPSPENPEIMSVRVGHRMIDRAFEATISFAKSDPKKSGRASEVISIKDVTADPCEPKLGSTDQTKP